MTHDNAEIIGKSVKNIYGSYMGKVVGTITDIDGTIKSVGVDCGTQGLQMILDEHLVTQEDIVIYIPQWRLDSQRLIREKKYTLSRLRALVEIMAEDDTDEMHVDAEIVQDQYRSKLASLQSLAVSLKMTLDTRLEELDDQLRSSKMLFFDAKIRYKSNEISEETLETVKLSTGNLIEHMSHEIKEIKNIKTRLDGLETQVQEVNDMISATATEDEHTSSIVAPMEAPLISSPSGVPNLMEQQVADVKDPLMDQKPNHIPNTDSETITQAVEASDVDVISTQSTTNDTVATGAEGSGNTIVDTNVPQEPVIVPTPAVDAKAPNTAPIADANVSNVNTSKDVSDLHTTETDTIVQQPNSVPNTQSYLQQQQQQQQPLQQQTPSYIEVPYVSQQLQGVPQTQPSPNTFDHVQQHDEEVVFPEPPKNLAPQTPSQTQSSQTPSVATATTTPSPSSPKNDDDWLSRMESQ